METKLLWETGATMLVGVAVFGWIFTQSPNPAQLNSPKVAKQTVAQSQPGKRGDKIPSVVQQAPKQIDIKIEPVSLQTPDQALDQALQPTGNLLEVTATSLKMRSGPSSSTQLINVYGRGSTFEKIGQDGRWLQVRGTEDGTSGWMFADYLQTAN